MSNTFPKSQRLCSRKAIQHLFLNGKKIKQFPLQLIFQPVEREEDGVKAGFTVSKRNFKSAVKRNRIKRQMKEAYRLDKSALETFCREKNYKVDLFLIYQGSEQITFNEFQKKISFLLRRLQEQLAYEKDKA